MTYRLSSAAGMVRSRVMIHPGRSVMAQIVY